MDEIDYRTGGSIKSNTLMFKYVIISILLIFIIFILYRISKNVKINGENYYQRELHQHFNNLHGEEFDEDAKRAIDVGENIAEPRAIDHYRMGTALLINARDPHRAHRHFRDALIQINNGDVDFREAPFILNRIDDFNQMFIDFTDIEDLPVQMIMRDFFEQNNDRLHHTVKKAAPEISKDDPEFKQKVILSRQDWQSDSQNVHDSAMYADMKEQFYQIKDSNSKIRNAQLHDFREASNWLKTRYKDNPTKSKDIDKVLQMLNNNYDVSYIPNTKEQDIITTVWQRTYDPDNADKAVDMREALADAMLDCVEGGHVVCMSGRTKKIWQALACLDKEEDIGVLKSKQAIRNEIYQKSAKILNDYIGENGSVSEELKSAYNRDENTEQVAEMKEVIKKQIGDISLEYSNLLPKEQLKSIIEECQLVI